MAGQKETVPESTAEQVALANAARPASAEEAEERGRSEYGQWVANQQIFVGNALAYDVGHLVPASNVKLHGYDRNKQVVKYGSKEHNEIRAAQGYQPVES